MSPQEPQPIPHQRSLGNIKMGGGCGLKYGQPNPPMCQHLAAARRRPKPPPYPGGSKIPWHQEGPIMQQPQKYALKKPQFTVHVPGQQNQAVESGIPSSVSPPVVLKETREVPPVHTGLPIASFRYSRAIPSKSRATVAPVGLPAPRTFGRAVSPKPEMKILPPPPTAKIATREWEQKITPVLTATIKKTETITNSNSYDNGNHQKSTNHTQTAYKNYVKTCEDQLNGNGPCYTGQNSNSNVLQENLDLKRQLVLFKQQLEDKDNTIKLLQNQMVMCDLACA